MDLTSQDKAMFANIDRLVPGSILTDYAQEMVNRAEKAVLSRVDSRLNKPLYELACLRDEFSWEEHDIEHEAVAPDVIEQCVSCRMQKIIEDIMLATVPK